MTSHQAIMKCPWQWRQPFLDEKRESRKRKAGDGFFYDPVDPTFVDHLLPGHAKKFCPEPLESEEKEEIQQEIERLMLKKQEELEIRPVDEATGELYDPLMLANDDEDGGVLAADHAATIASTIDAHSVGGDATVSQENQAMVDCILLMTKSVEEACQASSLLASPLSVASSDEEDSDSGASSCDEPGPDDLAASPVRTPEKKTEFVRSSSLDLLSDNLHENFFAAGDDELLDFASPASISPNRAS